MTDLFGNLICDNRRYRKISGMNDYFLFNDIRNGPTTIHSWDLIATTPRQRDICYLLLRNRRKSIYGALDGNPLSAAHFQKLDPTIQSDELDALVDLGILKQVDYAYTVNPHDPSVLLREESSVLQHLSEGKLTLDALKESRALKKTGIPFEKVIDSLVTKNVLVCSEVRYEFKYTKISTGIEGINRIFLPKSETFPTLVASDTNDFVALKDVHADNEQEYKRVFLEKIFHKKQFRKISKEEACLIQGFPMDFKLPESRNRWMKLVGNSVSVPVVQMLGKAIMDTGCLDD